MRFSAVLVLGLLLLCPLHFAAFTFLNSTNGSNADETYDDYMFSRPSGIAVSGSKMFVSDPGKTLLYIFNGTTRQRIIRPEQSGTALNGPLRLAYEGGILYIADGIGGNVKAYSGSGYQIDNWNTGSNMQKPSGIAMDGQYLYITDLTGKRLFIYLRGSKTYFRIGLEQGGSDGQLSAPEDVKLYGDRFYISDSGKGLIFVYSKNLTYQYTIGRGKGGVTLRSPRGLDVYNDRVYVADATSNRVVVFTLDGYPIETLDSSTPGAAFSYPEDVVAADGRLYVADSFNKAVKIFSIDQATGNDTVLNLIKSANESSAQLASVQSVAQRLGVPFDPVSFASDLSSAESYYNNLVYSSAASIAQRVIEQSASAQNALSQAIEVKIRQSMKVSQDRVDAYRKKASGNALSNLSQFDNAVADVNIKLSAKSYSAAVDASLALPSLADAFISEAEGKGALEERERQKRLSSQLQLQIESLSSRIEKVKADSARYRHGFNLSNSEAMLSLASDAVAGGDFESANHSIELAAIDVSSYESAIAGSAGGIDSALANITAIEFGMNASASKPTLLPLDISQERLAISRAFDTAYTNPQLAIAMAQQAADAASAKAQNAQAISVALAALLIVLGLAGLIALAFFLHLRTRKRRGLEGAASAGKAKEKPAR